MLHRMQFAPLGENVMVVQTYLSATKDLFVVIKSGNMYQVLFVCLDLLNDHGADDESVYRFTKVLEYSSN